MDTKQVNIAVPIKLYDKVEEYVEEYGYRNAQDLFLDLAWQKVIFEDKTKDNFEDIEKLSQKSLMEVWDNREDEIWNEYLKK